MYIFISYTFKLQFIGHFNHAVSYAIKHSNTNHAFQNFLFILPLANLTYTLGAQDNESSARSRWAASWYKKGFIIQYGPAGLLTGIKNVL